MTVDKIDSPSAATETRRPHTRLLRIGLAVDQSRIYWSHPDASRGADCAKRAFEEDWFGGKTLARVKLLLVTFDERFGAFPSALRVLNQWQPSAAVTCRNICHWHTQLTDPFYRKFSGEVVPRSRQETEAGVDRDSAGRWLEEQTGGRWSASTTMRMANGLVTSVSEAGLCGRGRGSRRLLPPEVSDEALTYLLYLLRQMDFDGSMLDNPYLASVGLTGNQLEQALARLQSVELRRNGEHVDLEWRYPSLAAWAEHELHPTVAAP